jgi:hypothetical protein
LLTAASAADFTTFAFALFAADASLTPAPTPFYTCDCTTGNVGSWV